MRRDSRGVIRPFVNTKRPLFPSIAELSRESNNNVLRRRRLLAENTVGLLVFLGTSRYKSYPSRKIYLDSLFAWLEMTRYSKLHRKQHVYTVSLV